MEKAKTSGLAEQTEVFKQDLTEEVAETLFRAILFQKMPQA